MKLRELLTNIDVISIEGDMEVEISSMENDSRKVREGSLFVAVKGYETDGHLFCRQAIAQGAVAIILEDKREADSVFCREKGVSLIQVANSRATLARIASIYFDRPSEKMNMVGITGTNGKTSTALLVYRILEESGHIAGVIGTISNFIHTKELATERTTPEAHDLQKLFAEMVAESVETAVMEVSSHALELYRVDGMTFRIAAFTNLSLDHLDFHHTMENYLAAKSKLFQMAEIGIVNSDDPAAKKLLENHRCQKLLFYSIKDRKADFFADRIEHHLTGTTFDLHLRGQVYPVSLKTPGNFSVYNSLAAIAITESLGILPETILVALEKHSQVKGRFQTIALPTAATAIVDYAHTPDGLENVLKSIADFKCGKVITVFGCGGDRDRSKRPLMAKVAEKYSDYIVITSDNPRTEDPQTIVEEVASGISGKAFEIVLDRRQAIEKALAMTKANDVVLIAGKGHEDYQIIGKQKIHFDDVEIVQEWGRSSDLYSG